MTSQRIAPSTAEAASTRLRTATVLRRPCAPVRDLINAGDVAEAYAVQQLGIATRIADGARVVGRKIGLTSPAVQAQLGVHQPDFGVLMADMEVPDRGIAPMDRLLQPKVEAEIAFVLRADADVVDPDRVRDAVDYAVAALEIVDSRIVGWDISFVDTVADNASSGLFVLGEQRVGLDAIEPSNVAMEMTLNGQVVSTGTGVACLGDPLEALAWLARTARDLGDPLRGGQVVLSGALGPMSPVSTGDDVRAHITGLGSVQVRFS
jgi:2-keto-4-pentenoate hydratase